MNYLAVKCMWKFLTMNFLWLNMYLHVYEELLSFYLVIGIIVARVIWFNEKKLVFNGIMQIKSKNFSLKKLKYKFYIFVSNWHRIVLKYY